MASYVSGVLATPKVVGRSLLATFAAYQACLFTPVSYGEIGGQQEVSDERFPLIQYLKDFWFASAPEETAENLQSLAAVDPNHSGYLHRNVAHAAVRAMMSWVMPGIFYNTQHDIENQYGAIGQEREKARLEARLLHSAHRIQFGHLWKPRNIDYSCADTLFGTPVPAMTIRVTATSEIGVIGGERTLVNDYSAGVGRLGSPIDFSCPPPRAKNHDDWE